eukprot:71499_1
MDNMQNNQQPTEIVDRKPEPRTLMILPPSFDESNSSHQEMEVLDGLPYIEYFTDMQIANAEKAVHDEMRTMQKQDYLKEDPLPTCRIIDSTQFEEQIERIYRKEKILSFDRYECLGPRKDQIQSLAIWKKEIANCKSMYGHQLNRLLNLELTKKYNAAKWSNYNDYLRNCNEYQNTVVHELQDKMDDVNRKRKMAQLEAQPKLNKLESEWWALVSKNNEIELQSQILRTQIDAIQQIKHKYANMNTLEDETRAA